MTLGPVPAGCTAHGLLRSKACLLVMFFGTWEKDPLTIGWALWFPCGIASAAPVRAATKITGYIILNYTLKSLDFATRNEESGCNENLD